MLRGCGALSRTTTSPHPDPSAGASPRAGNLPRRHSLLEVSPARLALSAVKRAEDGRGLTFRVYNPSGEPVEGAVTFAEPVTRARLVTLEELDAGEAKCEGARIELAVPAKKIVTVQVQFD